MGPGALLYTQGDERYTQVVAYYADCGRSTWCATSTLRHYHGLVWFKTRRWDAAYEEAGATVVPTADALGLPVAMTYATSGKQPRRDVLIYSIALLIMAAAAVRAFMTGAS